MASKTISIRDDVYKLLKDAKREEESFSDAIERLLKKDKVNLSEYFGALKEDPILDRLEADSKRIRETARSRVRLFPPGFFLAQGSGDFRQCLRHGPVLHLKGLIGPILGLQPSDFRFKNSGYIPFSYIT